MEGLIDAYNRHDRSEFFSYFAEDLAAVWESYGREEHLDRSKWMGWINSQEIARGDWLELLSIDDRGFEVTVHQDHHGFRDVYTRDGKVLPNSRHEKVWSEVVTYRIEAGLVVQLSRVRRAKGARG